MTIICAELFLEKKKGKKKNELPAKVKGTIQA
jgi:hypothetical protein